MKVKKVALYARVSTLNHGQDPEVQLRELREFCARRGFEILEKFVDKGIKGSREQRPALDKLMAACRKRIVDAAGKGDKITAIEQALDESLFLGQFHFAEFLSGLASGELSLLLGGCVRF